jgi:hypothetical protein
MTEGDSVKGIDRNPFSTIVYGMKTTLDIPQDVLDDALRFTGAKTKRDAIVTAVSDYNRRQKLASLAGRLGTFDDFVSVKELHQLRSVEIRK